MMKRTNFGAKTAVFHLSSMSVAAIVAAAALASGCAGVAPGATTKTAAAADAGVDLAGASCAQLDADIAQTDETLRAAQAKNQDAWKVVVPFAVAARYASSKSAANNATQQLEALHAEATRRGCPGHAAG